MTPARRGGKRVGYIRVSSVDQNTERQLEGVHVDKRFSDEASGKDTKRPQLHAALEYLRDGDVLVVHSMDRLARNLDDLRNVVSDLTARGVVVEFVKEKLTFTGADNAMSKLLLSVMGAFEEFERSLLKERQREGIALTKKAGVYKGRKRALTPERAANSAIVLGQAKRKLRLRATSASAARCCTAISSPQVCLSFPMPEPGSMPRSA